jgi:hypothetical protein
MAMTPACPCPAADAAQPFVSILASFSPASYPPPPPREEAGPLPAPVQRPPPAAPAAVVRERDGPLMAVRRVAPPPTPLGTSLPGSTAGCCFRSGLYFRCVLLRRVLLLHCGSSRVLLFLALLSRCPAGQSSAQLGVAFAAAAALGPVQALRGQARCNGGCS